ncbi:AAA family ATPase [Arthrobacter sp. efr-133-R2A-63]|uniref:AAA family ATPase n=1 Tax=Arthrobacter sp. efr-133-R2A-63 TaxID=3040278 RepID=UPI00254C8ECD|nr:AAA family ATPase [Arthrobacter sp. efr-133-R2A-63]
MNSIGANRRGDGDLTTGSPIATDKATPDKERSLFTAGSVNSRVWKATTVVGWEGFIEWLDLDHFANHKECGGYVAGTFEGTQRTKETVLSRWALTLDADHADQDFRERVEALGFKAVAHTTFSHTPENPHWRVIIPLDKPVVNAEQFTAASNAVMEKLGWEQFDHTCSQPSRFMFRPSAKNGHHDYFEVDGPVATLEDILPDSEEQHPLDRFRAALDAAGKTVRGDFAQCPGHADRTPSLHHGWDESAQRVWMEDFGEAGCTEEHILEVLGLPPWAQGWSPEHDFAEPLPEGDEPESGEWDPADLGAILDGTAALGPVPSLLLRADGQGLLYPGKTHSLSGEPESGKSWLALAETALQLKAGGLCLFIDFEADKETVVSRLLALGAPPEQIRVNLHYMNPDTKPDKAAWKRLLAQPYVFAVIDGVTEACAVFGVKSIDNDEVAKWIRAFPRKIAVQTGAAVLLLDHVTKSTDGRGRFAIGAQAKLSSVTGAAFTVEVIDLLAPGRMGRLSIRVGKDRHGKVREQADPNSRRGDRTEAVAVAVFDSTKPGRVTFTLSAPVPKPERAVLDAFASLREKISRALEDAGKSMTYTGLCEAVHKDRAVVRKAIDWLVEHEYVNEVKVGRKSDLNSLNPYRGDE